MPLTYLPFKPKLVKNTTNINTIKSTTGREATISSFCTATKTSMSDLVYPKSMRARVVKSTKTDHTKRCFLAGLGFPPSVNMFNTNTAESTEVTKKTNE